MEILRGVLLGLRKYSDFTGRSTRFEFSSFVGFYFLTGFVLAMTSDWFGHFGQTVFAIWNVLMGLPAISVTVRRLHDVGRAGWWIIQLLVSIVLVMFLVTKEGPLSSSVMFFSTMILLLAIPVVYALFLPSWYAHKRD